MRRAKDNDGFTLIELLISLALLSLMAIYAIQAFTTLRSMNRVETELSAQMEVSAAARHLRQELSDARAVFQNNGDQNHKLYFAGAPQSLSFVAASNGEREVGGLYFVTFSLDSAGTLTEKRQLIGATLNDNVNESILLRGVESISFNYISETETSPNWSSPTQLPRAVGINISFAKPDKRRTAEILVRLQNVN